MILCLVFIFISGQAVVTSAADDLVDDLAHGRQIYHTGTSPSGVLITASLGDQPFPLPAEYLPCASCHGPDGYGRPEGGVSPSTITWSALTRPYEVISPDGRRHPAYTPKLLIRAITLGIDSANKPLGVAMPRFHLSKADAEALVSYLQHRGREYDPGLEKHVVRIGTLLPESGPYAELGQIVEAVLRAHVSEINAQGGVYGRRLELQVARTKLDLQARLEGLQSLLTDTGVFALVAPFLSGAEQQLTQATDAAKLPVIGPITHTPWLSALPGLTFYLLSGIEQQVRVLWDFAAGHAPAQGLRTSVVWTTELATAPAVEALRRQAKRWHMPAPKLLTYEPTALDPVQLASALADRHAIFFLGPGQDALRILNALGHRKRFPDLFIPGSLAGPLATQSAPAVFLAFPSLPVDMEEGAERWRMFAKRHNLPSAYPATQRLVSVASDLLGTALRQSGQNLSRVKFVNSLQNLYGYETGLTPQLSYGPNRRIGALGSYVVQVQATRRGFVKAADWIEPK